jgi:hypothetical protein
MRLIKTPHDCSLLHQYFRLFETFFARMMLVLFISCNPL